jgi:hypothetical protein
VQAAIDDLRRHHCKMTILQLSSAHPRGRTKGTPKLINSELADAPTIGVKVGAMADCPIKIARIQLRANQKGRWTQARKTVNRIWLDTMIKNMSKSPTNSGGDGLVSSKSTHSQKSQEGGGAQQRSQTTCLGIALRSFLREELDKCSTGRWPSLMASVQRNGTGPLTNLLMALIGGLWEPTHCKRLRPNLMIALSFRKGLRSCFEKHSRRAVLDSNP